MQFVCDCETDFHFTILAGNGFVYNCIGCDCLTCNQAPLLYLFSSVILFFFDTEWYESFITRFFYRFWQSVIYVFTLLNISSLICFPCVWSDSVEFLSLATSLIMLAPVSSNVAQFLKIQDSAIESSKQVINSKVIFVFVHYEIQARSPIAENKKNVTYQ